MAIRLFHSGLRRLRPWAALCLLPSVLHCKIPPPSQSVAAVTAADVRNQDTHGRPSITLVNRRGDPQKGLAVAVYVDRAPRISASLAWLLETRLRRSGVAAETEASPLGLVVSLLVDSPDQLAERVVVLHSALTTPITETDVTSVRSQWRQSPPRQARTDHEAMLAWCAGELLLSPGVRPPPPDREKLQSWLDQLNVDDVAFAVVGTGDYLNRASAAVGSLPVWRADVASPEPFAPRAQTLRGIEVTSESESALSVAMSGVPAAVATALAEHLGRSNSLLSVRMQAGFPAWDPVRVTATLHRGGACLRADFHTEGAAPTVGDMRRSIAVAFNEMEHALGAIQPSVWVLNKQVLALSKPHTAASVAAWQALTLRPASKSARGVTKLAHYSGRLSDPDNSPQFSAPTRLTPASRIEGAQLRLEPGQGRFWMLLASPCGTRGEDANSAGLGALMLHSLARQHGGDSQVEIEPWVTADAMGLLAHAGPLRQQEGPRAQAERVAEVLARALLHEGPSTGTIVNSRAALKLQIGGQPVPSYWLALRQSSENHPSWLEPRGSWTALSDLSAYSIRQERVRWVAGKLRLAVLGNYNEAQVRAGQNRLLNLLEGVNRAEAECPSVERAQPLSGRYRLDSPGQRGAAATVVISWPGDTDEAHLVAQYTVDLMNRSGGWLEQALFAPGLVSSARARIMGGQAAEAIVVEIVAIEGRASAAVAQVRGLLARLKAGAFTAQDLQWARGHHERQRARRQLDPRARIVQLWSAQRPISEPTEQQVHFLYQRAFGAGHEVVVLSGPPR